MTAFRHQNSLNICMKDLKNPFLTTVRNIKNSANARVTVRQIQNKIFETGLCSDTELEYLRTHSDWDRVNPRTPSNLG